MRTIKKIPLIWLLSLSVSAAADGSRSHNEPGVDSRFNSGVSNVSRSYRSETRLLNRTQLQGISKPKLDARLRPNSPGTVIAIHVREGQKVSAGTPLVTIDNRVAKAAVELAQQRAESNGALRQAELAMQQSHAILARTEIAMRTNASTGFELAARQNQNEQAVAAFEQQQEAKRIAEADLQLAKAQLQLLTLTAPFDGEILEIRASIGNLVEPNEFAVRIADLDSLQVEMHLPVSLLGKVETQQVCVLETRIPKETTLPCVANYVSPVIEPTSGTFRVLFDIPNSDRRLPAGTEIWFKSAVTPR